MGDLVLTDLREGEASIRLPKDLLGRLSLRDVSNKLVLEVHKTAHREMVIGVEQGYYHIVLEQGKDVSEAVLIVDEKKEYRLGEDLFHRVIVSENATRGGSLANLFFPVGVRVRNDSGDTSLFLSLFAGSEASVNGVMASGFYNRTFLSSSGYQGSIVANIANADFSGFQSSLAVDITQGDLFGVQLAPLFNLVGGNLGGLQVSGLINMAAGNVKFGQIGAVNIVEGEGAYFQAGAFNSSRKSIRGLQFGVGNIGKEVKGVQFGLVNFADDMSGVQVGIVNISKKLNGLPIGLIDIQFNGENHVDSVLSAPFSKSSELFQRPFSTVYFRFGSRYFYKYFSVGFPVATEQQSSAPAYLAGAGLGLRVPVLFPGLAAHLDGGAAYHSPVHELDLTDGMDILKDIVPHVRVFASWKFVGNAGLLCGLDELIYTKYFHTLPQASPDFYVRTGYGFLVIYSRLFFGVQL